jgi:hypothetical protein
MASLSRVGLKSKNWLPTVHLTFHGCSLVCTNISTTLQEHTVLCVLMASWCKRLVLLLQTCKTAKYKRSTPALSFVHLTDKIDVTGGVKKYLQPYIDRKIFFWAFEWCSYFVHLNGLSRVIVRWMRRIGSIRSVHPCRKLVCFYSITIKLLCSRQHSFFNLLEISFLESTVWPVRYHDTSRIPSAPFVFICLKWDPSFQHDIKHVSWIITS